MLKSCRWRLPAPAASAPVDGGWAQQAQRPGRAASGASEQSAGGDLLSAELHSSESLPVPEPAHRTAGQSQPGHRHREGGKSSQKVISSSGKCFTFLFLFSSVEKEKCSGGLTGETVTGEKLSLQSGSSDQHWVAESSTGTKHPPRDLLLLSFGCEQWGFFFVLFESSFCLLLLVQQFELISVFCFCSQEKNSTIQHYQSLMAKKQKEYQQSLEKSKTSQTEQQHSLEMVKYSNIRLFFCLPNLNVGNLPSINLFINDRLTHFHQFYMLDSSLEPLHIMTGCWFALVTVISVLCSCSCRWMRLSFGCWRWSRNWSCFTARGTRLRMQLPCCRTLWTNSHRLESITIAPLTSLTFCVCDHSVFLFCKMLLKLQQKQDELRHREELLQTFREQAEQSASKVCATVNAIETEQMQYLIVHNLLPRTRNSWKRRLWPVGTSGARTAVVSVGVQRGAERLPAADGGGEEELREWTAEEEWNGELSHAARPSLNFTSFLLCFHVCWVSVSPQTLSLQEKLRGATLVCRSADEQNVQLQLSLQQQQAMVTESAARVSELEESQSQLQTEVGLEKKTDRFKIHTEMCNSFYFFISPNIRGLMK